MTRAVVASFAASLLFAGCGTSVPDHSTVAASAPAVAPAQPTPDPRVFRVCADPNNLPYSNAREEGFENQLAQLVARELGRSVEYTWWPQRRGFVRQTVGAGDCDVVMGVPTSFERLAVTRPYYRSSYVFLSRTRDRITVRSLDDPQLRSLRIGVHMIGDDGANAPPAHALARRGIVRNVVGFSIYGDYAQPNPPARLVEAVAAAEIDLAIVWGPIAGYFARQQRVPLTAVPVTPEIDLPFLPFVYDIGVGVNRADLPLVEAIDAVLVSRAAEIEALLEEFAIPHVTRVRRSVPPDGPAPGFPARSEHRVDR